MVTVTSEGERSGIVGSSAYGAILGFSAAAGLPSAAAIIYVGPFQEFLPIGAVLLLLGAGLGRFVLVLSSRVPTIQGGQSGEMLAILGVGAVSLGAIPELASGSEAVRFSTIFAYGVIATAVFTLTLYGARLFGLDRLGEFIPYPVIAGFLASVGWVLFVAALQAATSIPLTLSNLPQFLDATIVGQAALMILAAIFIEQVIRRSKAVLAMPAAILAVLVGFYAVVFAFGLSVDQLRNSGWLLENQETGSVLDVLGMLSIDQIAFGAIVGQMPTILMASAMGLISVLISLGAIEIGCRTTMSLKTELNAVANANAAAAFLGPNPSTPWEAQTIMAHEQGIRTRLPSLVSALMFVLLALVAAPVIQFFPKFLLASMVMVISMLLLRSWIFDLWQRIERLEYFIVVAIFLVSFFFGIVAGMVVGFIICAAFFLLQYSTLSLVRSSQHGMALNSDVERPREQMEIIERQKDRVVGIELEGYLFFGTASQLLRLVQDRIAQSPTSIDFLVIDMRLVAGADSSAFHNLTRLTNLAEQEDFWILLTETKERILSQLERAGIKHDCKDSRVLIMGETDLALEWVEEQLLAEHDQGVRRERPIEEILSDLLGSEQLAGQLLPYLSRMELDVGDTLFERGDDEYDIYLIQDGAVSLTLPKPDGSALRQRKFGPGATIGIIDYYDKDPRDTSAIAEKKSVVFKLKAETLRDLNENSPKLAIALHEAMGMQMAHRLNALSLELWRTLT